MYSARVAAKVKISKDLYLKYKIRLIEVDLHRIQTQNLD